MQETGSELWNPSRNRHDLRIFPVQFGHAPGGRVAMHALRVVEIKENVTRLERIRLAIDSDGVRSLETGGARGVNSEREPRKNRNRAENHRGRAEAVRPPAPGTCHQRHRQHYGVSYEEP